MSHSTIKTNGPNQPKNPPKKAIQKKPLSHLITLVGRFPMVPSLWRPCHHLWPNRGITLLEASVTWHGGARCIRVASGDLTTVVHWGLWGIYIELVRWVYKSTRKKKGPPRSDGWHLVDEFSYQRWWFPIAMLVYWRVPVMLFDFSLEALKPDLMAFPEPPVPVSVGKLQYVAVNEDIWKD